MLLEENLVIRVWELSIREVLSLGQILERPEDLRGSKDQLLDRWASKASQWRDPYCTGMCIYVYIYATNRQKAGNRTRWLVLFVFTWVFSLMWGCVRVPTGNACLPSSLVDWGHDTAAALPLSDQQMLWQLLTFVINKWDARKPACNHALSLFSLNRWDTTTNHILLLLLLWSTD